MSSFVEQEAVLPETLVELVEYDLVADFRELIQRFPDSDWFPAYRHYRQLKTNTPLHDEWFTVFWQLRKCGYVLGQ